MKNATKVSSNDGPRACMGVRVCVHLLLMPVSLHKL